MKFHFLCGNRYAFILHHFLQRDSLQRKGNFIFRNFLVLSFFCFGDEVLNKTSNERQVITSFIEFYEGDYRPLIAGADFALGGSSPYQWEIYTGGIWQQTLAAPQSASPSRILIDKAGITGGANSSNGYNDIIILNNGELILKESAASLSVSFLNNGKTLEVLSGGRLVVKGDIKMGNTTFLLIRAGGSMILDQNSISNIHPIWNGVEAFEEGSAVTIKDWNWSAIASERSLIENASAISDNSHGYKFGNLIFDINPPSAWTLISGATGIVSLCENDLYIDNASSNFITGASHETGINGFLVNGKMTISKGPFGFGSSNSAGNFNHQFIINGTFECRSSSALKIHHSFVPPDSLAGFVTFKNDVLVRSTVSSFINDVANKNDRRMYVDFNGGTSVIPLIIDIAPIVIATSMNVKANSYVMLRGQDLRTNSKASNVATITIENKATLDFGWAADGTTPLVIKRDVANVGTNKFVSDPGSIMRLTSPDGLHKALQIGNVQYASSNKNFSTDGTFWYIGKTNQLTGDGPGASGSARQIIIEMADQNLSTTLTQRCRFTNGTIASSTGGKLDIRRGQFLETPTAFIDGVINENASGTLYMSPGTLYRITSLSDSGGQANIPRMSGVTFPYKLDGGTIELSAAGNQTLRGNKAYRNLTFSNSGTKSVSSAPSSITGTILIKDDAVLNVDANGMGGPGTNLTMEGNSKYINAGVLTKPDAQGTYTLGQKTSIEFSNSNNLTIQDIRLGLSAENPIAYNDIIVSGNNVGNTSIASTPIKMQPSSTFTVLSGATFRHKNANGFSGASNTCLTNIPAISLAQGSTIEYNRDNGTNQNISIQQPYQNLILSGSGNKTAPSGLLLIEGNLSKTGTANFVHNNGTILFNGNKMQTLSGTGSTMLFHNFTNDNSAAISIDNDVVVTKELRLKPGSTTVLNTGYIVLKSDKNNTANVAEIPINSTISYNTGRFVVERFINTGLPINGAHPKSWQFLSTPAFGETVRATWQENMTVKANYGTIITNNDLTSWSSQGFDGYSGGGPSMKTYQPLTNSWLGIPNTGIKLENPRGYMIFIRGDRTVTGTAQEAKPTTLQTIGKLYAPQAGYEPESISVMPGRYQSVGNPYASRIDMEYMYDNGMMEGLDDSFYVWDPFLTGTYGVGGYQTISKHIGYMPVPGSVESSTQYYSSNVKANFIESTQAFFVHNSGTVNASMAFTEKCKAGDSRLVHKVESETRNEILRCFLYSEPGIIADGNAVVFGDDFSNSIDRNDALKMTNAGENFAIWRGGQLISVEARKHFDKTDTIFFDLQNLAKKSYFLRFMSENIRLGYDAILIDQYLEKKTQINLGANASYEFSITNDPASSLANRFLLVLNQQTALPVNHINLKVAQKNGEVHLKWKMADEKNITGYVIEKSADGIQFKALGKREVQNVSTDCQFRDPQPYLGNNYYRVIAVGTNNEKYYSSIASTHFKEISSVNVYPNPVKNGLINLVLANKPPGVYQLRLLNASGQSVFSKSVMHSGETNRQSYSLGKYPRGIYMLELNRIPDEPIVLKVSVN
jgi:hypothetical protein